MKPDEDDVTRVVGQMSERTHDQEIAGLKLEIKALKKALGTLLAWLPQSANSPIRQDEASRLLNMMNGFEV